MIHKVQWERVVRFLSLLLLTTIAVLAQPLAPHARCDREKENSQLKCHCRPLSPFRAELQWGFHSAGVGTWVDSP
ncbi:hypothetical protein P175DRAFT_024380 [Aspergillus ochraceoroseus IBT 24754]|uniref:Extracellular membrane protein CFEM domain-containing protein n=1 Tax=Aspergillus ochraceoroseus IBT 24754 TaxID=1392256 RepID=A0A2T5M6T8_9EURO|nr:uncharacterized protein P175DRAFT_024380 [Aspergillus ochraceoroseus IBT 24754]PTU24239.1 hypothetical protein P175DRAFT_024380 [Aspergillus ochraceoroseus IBT 24754]